MIDPAQQMNSPPTDLSPVSLTGRRIALVVGVNQGAEISSLTRLEDAERDAYELAQVLQSPACAFEVLPALTGAEAGAGNVRDAIGELLDGRTDDDLLVFHFSGHTQPLVTQHEGDDIFFVTSDFRLKTAQRDPSRFFSMRWLWQHLYQVKSAGNILIILDCCYAGNMAGAYPDPLHIDLGKLIAHYKQRDSIVRASHADCLRVILAATRYNQTTNEDTGHGLMSGLILSALHGHEDAALDSDGNLSIKSLHSFLERQYITRQLPQTPTLLGNITRPCILARYPERSQKAREQRESEERQWRQTQEKKDRLQARIVDHSGFIRARLESFVGREKELAEIRQFIAEKVSSGGYVTITGQAGQGKSSVIAKLVEEYGFDQVAYHFIPLNPGPDHQTSLLRNIIARPILKYDMSEIYITTDSRSALCDYFSRVLTELTMKGGQEVIFIDGLDQVEEDISGVRDLSFLPTKPPSGVVFVLGTRPNDTLKPLELLKPYAEYKLPNLSRGDFDLILSRRSVYLDHILADRFYQAMQQNALYLDLVAKELAAVGLDHSEAIIKRVVDNPDNLFSVAMDRLRRQRQQWEEVIKPILGVMLAAGEPLGLRTIRTLISKDDDAVKEGLQRLGGLVVQDGRGRFYLYHLKLRDYLRQDERQPDKEYVFATDEEERCHRRLADWCAGGKGGLAAIWHDMRGDILEQERRVYARKHYITHLFRAKAWNQLWKVLDSGEYGRGKLQNDRSTRSYVLDLDMGRQATTSPDLNFDEGVALLPNLWRYSLLRCSLTTQADECPDILFETLLLVGREQEAIGLAELMTRSAQKARVFSFIGGQVAKQVGREQDGLQLLIRARETAQAIADTEHRVRALHDVALALVGAGDGEQAIVAARMIDDDTRRDVALHDVALALAGAGDGEQAIVAARALKDTWTRNKALNDIALAFAQARNIDQVMTTAAVIDRDGARVNCLLRVTLVLIEVGELDIVHNLIDEVIVATRAIVDTRQRSAILRDLAVACVQAGLLEHAFIS
jgi:Caspase domain